MTDDSSRGGDAAALGIDSELPAAGAVRRVARNTGAQITGDALARVAQLGLYVVMGRVLGSDGLGVFTLAISVVLLIDIAGFGTDLLVTREVARERAAVDRLFWNCIAMKLALGAVGLAFALAFAQLAGFAHTVKITVGLMAAAKLVELLSNTIYATLRGAEDMVPVALGVFLQRLLTAVAGSVALLAFDSGVTVVAAAWLASSALTLGLMTIVLLRRRIRPAMAVSWRRARRILVQAAPLGITLVLVAVLARVDVMILSLFESNAAIGLYGAAYRLFEGTYFVSAAFGIAAFPVLSRLRTNTSPTVRSAFELSFKAMAAALLPLGAALVLFGGEIVTAVFGPEFEGAATATRLLGAAIPLHGLFVLGALTVTSQDRQGLIPWVTGLVVLENIALNLALIPSHGLDGAAAAMALSEVTLMGGMIFFAVRAVGGMSLLRVSLAPLAGCAGMAAAALVLGEGVAGLAVGICQYPLAVLAVESTFFREDMALLVHAVRRRTPAEASS
jgi:O-antigen/teichoic acid export membrane protein